MKQLLFILVFFISTQVFAQGPDQFSGTWLAKNTDSTSKERKEIEFQFKKNGDFIIIKTKDRLKVNTAKSTVSFFQSSSVLIYNSLDNGQIYSHRYHYSFPSADVLVLTNQDHPDDVMTLEKKKG